MTVTARAKTIVKLALPITLGLGSSFLMAFIDLLMVKSLGNKALAAIGLASISYQFLLVIVMSMSPAVSGIVARRRGENSDEAQCLPLNGALMLVLLIGIPLTLFIYFITPFYFPLITPDPEVIKEGVPYLQTIVIGTVAFGMASAFKGYWTGIERPNVYLLTVLFVNSLNIFLNYVFIYGNFGFTALGTKGAGLASATSISVGVVIYFITTLIHFQGKGFIKLFPHKELLRNLLTMGVPVALNGMFLSASTILLYWMVGQIGTSELAISVVLFQFGWLILVFSMGLGQASAVLVSNAIGKGKKLLATQWGWDAGRIGLAWTTILGIPLFLFPEWFLFYFLPDEETIALAVIPFQLLALTEGAVGLSTMFSATLFSVGEGKRVMLVTTGSYWLFCLPAIWIVGPHLKYGILEVTIVQAISSVLTAILIVGIWQQGRWKEIKL